MKTVSTLLLCFLISLTFNSNGQTCNILAHPSTILISSDTTITYNSSGSFKSYIPCAGKTVTLNGMSTAVDTFYLRAGTKLIIDSGVAFLGGFVVYADSGAYFDANFQQVQYLTYSNAATILDTISWGSANSCSNVLYNYSAMLGPHSCSPTAVSKFNLFENNVITTVNDWQITFAHLKNTKAILYNMYGQKIAAYELQSNMLHVPHSNLPNAMYVLVIYERGIPYSIKLKQ